MIYIYIYIYIYSAFSLEFVSLWKKYNVQVLLLLNRCKLSYFISYRCLNLTRCHDGLSGVGSQSPAKVFSGLVDLWCWPKNTTWDPPKSKKYFRQKIADISTMYRYSLFSNGLTKEAGSKCLSLQGWEILLCLLRKVWFEHHLSDKKVKSNYQGLKTPYSEVW